MKIRQSSLLYRVAKWQNPSSQPFKNGCDILLGLMNTMFVAGILLLMAAAFSGLAGSLWFEFTGNVTQYDLNGNLEHQAIARLGDAFIAGLPFAFAAAALGWIVKKWCDNATVVITKKS